ISPTTETVVSINVQDRNVSLTLTLKYSLKSQNPPSFIWEKKMLPAPVAKTNNSGLMTVCPIMGVIMFSAVRAATVAEQTLTRIRATIIIAISIGYMLRFDMTSASASLMPVLTITSLIAPAPAITNKTTAMLAIALESNSITFLVGRPVRIPKK